METTVIEILAQVRDETATGTNSALKNLSKIEQAALSLQKTLGSLESGIEVSATLQDGATGGLFGIANLGNSLEGQVFSFTSKLTDLATSPLLGIMDLMENPLEQTYAIFGENLPVEEEAVGGFSSSLGSVSEGLNMMGLGESLYSLKEVLEGISGLSKDSAGNLLENPSVSGSERSMEPSFFEKMVEKVFGSSSESSLLEKMAESISSFGRFSDRKESVFGSETNLQQSVLEQSSDSVWSQGGESSALEQMVEKVFGSSSESSLLGTMVERLSDLGSFFNEKETISGEAQGSLVSYGSVSSVLPTDLGSGGSFASLRGETRDFSKIEEMETVLESGLTQVVETLETGVSGLFGESFPSSMEALWGEVNEKITLGTLSASEKMGEGISLFFQGDLTEKMENLWCSTGETMASTINMVTPTMEQGVTEFFGRTVPSSVESLFGSASETMKSTSSSASSVIGGTVASFFTSATSAISSMFQSASFSSLGSVISGSSSVASSATSSVTSSATSSSSTIQNTMVSSVVEGALTYSPYAEGGILSTPHLGLVAEDGPEAIIPLGEKRRSRGIALWEEAGRQLGVVAHGEGALAGGTFSSAVSDSKELAVPVTIGNISFAVTVPQGEGTDVVSAIRENISELTEEIALELAQKVKQSFSNMPILV